MVIISFLHEKENFDLKSKNPQEKKGDGSSSGWRDRYNEFMKRGPCKKAFMDLQDSLTFPKKSMGECSRNMQMCMEAHADYYLPLIKANKAIKEQLGERINKDLVHSNIPLSEVNDEESDKIIEKIWEKACCKESLTEFAVNCRVYDYDEADQFQLSSLKNKKEEITCQELLMRFLKCIDTHPDHPFFAIKKSLEEHVEKEFQALFSDPN